MVTHANTRTSKSSCKGQITSLFLSLSFMYQVLYRREKEEVYPAGGGELARKCIQSLRRSCAGWPACLQAQTELCRPAGSARRSGMIASEKDAPACSDARASHLDGGEPGRAHGGSARQWQQGGAARPCTPERREIASRARWCDGGRRRTCRGARVLDKHAH
jgi:hypothetical protein